MFLWLGVCVGVHVCVCVCVCVCACMCARVSVCDTRWDGFSLSVSPSPFLTFSHSFSLIIFACVKKQEKERGSLGCWE